MYYLKWRQQDVCATRPIQIGDVMRQGALKSLQTQQESRLKLKKLEYDRILLQGNQSSFWEVLFSFDEITRLTGWRNE